MKIRQVYQTDEDKPAYLHTNIHTYLHTVDTHRRIQFSDNFISNKAFQLSCQELQTVKATDYNQRRVGARGCTSLITVYTSPVAHPPHSVSPQPAASEAILILCSQAVTHLCVQMVLLAYAEHVVSVWCVEVGAIRCQVRLIAGDLGWYQLVIGELLGSVIEGGITAQHS